MTAEGWRLPPC